VQPRWEDRLGRCQGGGRDRSCWGGVAAWIWLSLLGRWVWDGWGVASGGGLLMGPMAQGQLGEMKMSRRLHRVGGEEDITRIIKHERDRNGGGFRLAILKRAKLLWDGTGTVC
jgi:hypothetical protein